MNCTTVNLDITRYEQTIFCCVI